SAGPVHLTGPTADFHGTGLSLNYNPRRERLEHLEVFKGESLRFRAPAADEEEESPQAGPEGDSATEGPAQPSADPAQRAPASGEGPAPAPGGDEDASVPQFYLARFNDNNRVHAPSDPEAPDDDVAMTGDVLTALFSL